MVRTASTTLLCAALLIGPTIIGSTAAAAPAAPRSISFADAVRPASGPLVLPVVKGGLLNGLAKEADAAAGGAIAEAIRLAKFSGDPGKTLALYGKGPYPSVLLIGVGEAAKSAVDLRR